MWSPREPARNTIIFALDFLLVDSYLHFGLLLVSYQFLVLTAPEFDGNICRKTIFFKVSIWASGFEFPLNQSIKTALYRYGYGSKPWCPNGTLSHSWLMDGYSPQSYGKFIGNLTHNHIPYSSRRGARLWRGLYFGISVSLCSTTPSIVGSAQRNMILIHT